MKSFVTCMKLYSMIFLTSVCEITYLVQSMWNIQLIYELPTLHYFVQEIPNFESVAIELLVKLF